MFMQVFTTLKVSHHVVEYGTGAENYGSHSYKYIPVYKYLVIVFTRYRIYEQPRIIEWVFLFNIEGNFAITGVVFLKNSRSY